MALNVLCFFFCFYTRNGQIPEEGVGKTYDVFYSYIFGPFHPEKIPLVIPLNHQYTSVVVAVAEYIYCIYICRVSEYPYSIVLSTSQLASLRARRMLYGKSEAAP